jgi:hypothetical protein
MAISLHLRSWEGAVGALLWSGFLRIKFSGHRESYEMKERNHAITEAMIWDGWERKWVTAEMLARSSANKKGPAHDPVLYLFV